jgi:hypothetical protein
MLLYRSPWYRPNGFSFSRKLTPAAAGPAVARLLIQLLNGGLD